jgi:hypothetical protein
MESTAFARIRLLIKEAIERLNAFGRQDELALLPIFIDARRSLDTNAANRSAQILLLSSTNRRITRAEKQVVSWIIGDQRVNSNEMSHLVRVRLICAQILNLLSDELESIRGRKI